MASPTFSIRIISDSICPFCYLGLARLTRALQSFPNDTHTISWHAYYLNPDASTTSKPIAQALAEKFGSGERVQMMQARIQAMGREEGINFTNQGRVGSTRDSHRLVQLGKRKGNDVENRVVREMMRMYFEEGGDITSHDDLVKAVGKAGVAEDEAREWLKSDQGGREVDREVEEAYRLGVRGVPHVTINGKFEVHGAEDVSVFVDALKKAKAAAS